MTCGPAVHEGRKEKRGNYCKKIINRFRNCLNRHTTVILLIKREGLFGVHKAVSFRGVSNKC